MALERHRARRYPLRAIAELTEVESDIRIRDWTGNLSLFGCQVDTPKLMPAGTKVWIKILFRSENFKALGKVVYALRNIHID